MSIATLLKRYEIRFELGLSGCYVVIDRRRVRALTTRRLERLIDAITSKD